MTQEEIDRWENYYQESARRDFERQIYKRCDSEDAEEINHGKEIRSVSNN